MSEIHEQKILVLDFGSQTTQLIARRVREARVYCEIHPCTMPLDEIKAYGAKGIILSGGPASCYEPGAPSVDPAHLRAGGAGAGHLLRHAGCSPTCWAGVVARGSKREYGPAKLQIHKQAGPFRDNEPRRAPAGVDEPRRPHRKTAPGLRGHGG